MRIKERDATALVPYLSIPRQLASEGRHSNIDGQDAELASNSFQGKLMAHEH
jgi:hypothetical protein